MKAAIEVDLRDKKFLGDNMNLLNSHKKWMAAIACSAAMAAGCDSITTGDEGPSIPRPTNTVVVGGTVTGLGQTRPVVLSMVTTNNGVNDGTQEFSVRGTEVLRFGAVAQGANYDISITRVPAGRTCTIANGSGTATGDVSNIAITCERDGTPLYSLTADIAPALAAAPPEGFAVTLTTEEGSETVHPAANETSVTFSLPIFYPPTTNPPEFAYTVTATNAVGGMTNKCLVNGGTGSLVDNDATTPADITTGITVASCLYTISTVAQYSAPPGGAASAMGGGGLQLGLRNQVTNNIDVQAPVINAFGPAAVEFPGTYASNSQALYEVVVQDHPDGQFCVVQNGGRVNLVTANANVTVQVACRDVPALQAQLKGIYQRDTPSIREVAIENGPVGSIIPEPRIQTRDFLAFFPNGTFIHGTHRATATAGVEHGFYDYDPGASTLGFTILTDTNGAVGSPAGVGFAACDFLFGGIFAAACPSGAVPAPPEAGTISCCGGTVSGPAWLDVAVASRPTGGLSGIGGLNVRLMFDGAFLYGPASAPLTATEVTVTPGAPGVAGKLSMRFGAESATNLNPVWTMTEPGNTPGQIHGTWATADSQRVFIYNPITYYGFHAGVNGAPNLQDACFTILDTRVAEGYYTRRGGDTGCMAEADAEVGTVATGTVDVPNATTTNSTAPLIPGFIGRLPGSQSNAVSSPSPVLFTVEPGSVDTLTIQNTLNNIPIHAPVIFERHTTY